MSDRRSSPEPQDAGWYRRFNDLERSKLDGCFHGVLQHSFALQLPPVREFHRTSGWLPRRGRQPRSFARVNARQHRYQRKAYRKLMSLFEDPTEAFGFKYPAQLLDEPHREDAKRSVGDYSWLVHERHTCLDPQPLAVLQGGPYSGLPKPFGWAGAALKGEVEETRHAWDGLIFALRGKQGWFRDDEGPIPNDLLIESRDCEPEADDPLEVSRVLLQLWAHWRSRLFGVSLAHRFFNVFLPPAILSPAAESGKSVWLSHAGPSGSSVSRGRCAPGAWLLQPFLSFVRDPDGPGCRRTCTFTTLYVPVTSSDGGRTVTQRHMSLAEVEAGTRSAWALAATYVGRNQMEYDLRGPLREYCENVGYALPKGKLTVRQWIEASIFSIARLRRDRLRRWWRVRSVPDDEELGDKVLTSLASSRVSVVTVVDGKLKPEEVRSWHEAGKEVDRGRLFPGSLPELVRAVSGRTYLAPASKSRVDGPLLDKDNYVECAVPAARCLITTTTEDSQLGYDLSALRLSVFTGYMALGAATAQALIRSSYHEIEAHADPKEFDEISKEFTRDFHEIYDLDIVWESYKRTYRAILEQFEIMHDYEALRRKLEALFNTTVAEFTEWQHTRLVFVSWLLVLVAVATVVVQIFGHG